MAPNPGHPITIDNLLVAEGLVPGVEEKPCGKKSRIGSMAAMQCSSVEMKGSSGPPKSKIVGATVEKENIEFDQLPYSYRTDDGVNRSENGFWGHLSREQETKLRETRRRCDLEGINLSYLSAHSLSWQLTLLRFLRGNKWVVDDCIEGIKVGMILLEK